MPDDLNTSDGDNAPPEYSVQDIGQMVFDLTVRVANDEKKIQSNRFAQESFERKQTALNLSIEDHLARLLTTVKGLARKPHDPVQTPTSATTARGWALPRSITVKPVGFDAETCPKLKFDPPRFDGEGVNMWIKKSKNIIIITLHYWLIGYILPSFCWTMLQRNDSGFGNRTTRDVAGMISS
ncbi:hypothetical protein SASPL_145391 [Salvia splendens]|uniref:Uncharacterized protein n=1 Tax=Salvia splendens TaxID=180675 RepID=A0A8X8WIZ7_SALSN|nr:hypothetical protein SASPL_145391 [Salvia splendens]